MYAAIMSLGPASQTFGGGRAVGSLPYAVFMVGFGVGGVLMGRVADRVGVIWPALIGSLCVPAGLFAAAHAQSLWQFVVALGVLCGLLGASFSFAPLVADISHWFTARRGLAVGIVASGTYVAGTVWPLVLQRLFDEHGWRSAFVQLAALTLCAMVPLTLVLVRRPSATARGGEPGTEAPSSRSVGFSPLTLQCVICCAGVGCCVAMSMPQVHIVPLVTDLGHAAARGAEMLSLMLGFGIVSRMASGWISDHIGGLRTLLLGSGLQALVLLAFVGADTLPMLYAISIAFGLSQGGIVPSYAIIIRRFFPAGEAGWRIGAALLFTIAGMALGAWMAGVLYDLTGSYTLSFVNAIAFNLVNMALAVMLLMRARAREVPGEAAFASSR
ncbi:MAG: MFS transporter, partial [Gammaproteobacteria bacterium]